MKHGSVPLGMAIMTSLLLGLAGCQYYADFKLKRTQADVQAERAALMRAYRQCLQRHEKDPARGKDACAAYTHSPREIEFRGGEGK